MVRVSRVGNIGWRENAINLWRSAIIPHTLAHREISPLVVDSQIPDMQLASCMTWVTDIVTYASWRKALPRVY